MRSRSWAVDAFRMSSFSDFGRSDAAARYSAEETFSRRIVRVGKREQPVELRHEELVELQLLGDDVARTEDPGQVPARVREALDETIPDRIGWVEENDGDVILRRRELGGLDRLVLEGDDQIDVIVNEPIGLGGGSVRLQVPPHQLDIAALRPS